MLLPGGQRLALEEFVPNATTETVAREGGPEARPAVQVRLQSKTAGHDLRRWLFVGAPGFANISLVIAGDAAHLARLTNTAASAATKDVRLLVALKDQRLDVPVAGNVGKDLAVPGSGVTARMLNYWPDFRMNDKHQIVSASDEPNNPVALVSLQRGESAERWFVFGTAQMRPMLREQKGEPIGAQVQLLAPAQRTGMMLIATVGGSQLYFASKNKSGPVAPGEPLELDAMDAQLTVERFVTNAVPAREIVRLPAGAEQGRPALRVTVHGAGTARAEWLMFGQPIALRGGTGNPMHLVFAWDSMELPFTVALEDFVVERDEGSQNVAGWTSKVLFTDAATGERKHADVWMNHPAVFKGYKFSQASWNPQDLKYTVLQVKKDPLWVIVLTWSGSGLTILGIALMFYARRWV
jgi:hypothetical protein